VLVQRVLMPGSGAESWTLLGDDGAVVEPVERYLAYLAAIERSPNTVRVARLRSSPPPAPSPEATTRASISSLRQRLESAKAEISRLRAENSALRDQLARQLGAQRAQQATPSVSGPR
jgi:hypothetical protein